MTKKENEILSNRITQATIDFRNAVNSPDVENYDIEQAVMFALLDLQLALEKVNK